MRRILLLIIIVFFPINVFASSAKSTVVMDNDSGRVLYKNNSNEKMLIASTTKIMTCIIAIENSDLSKKVTVGDEILNVYGVNELDNIKVVSTEGTDIIPVSAIKIKSSIAAGEKLIKNKGVVVRAEVIINK